MNNKGNNEIKTLSHSTYRCQYHIVFAPKYRRQEIYGKIKKDIGEIIRKLCEQKGVEIIEAEACKDHIHLLVSIPPYLSVAQFMGYLKGKSSLSMCQANSIEVFSKIIVIQTKPIFLIEKIFLLIYNSI